MFGLQKSNNIFEMSQKLLIIFDANNIKTKFGT